jgi:hypothetical protein
MPRQLRIEYPGAIYHVMNRGDHREAIFRDDIDWRRFVATHGEACAKTDWQVQAYCLMLNHFHLVVGDARGQPCGGDAVVLEHLHGATQPAAQIVWASVQRTLQVVMGS